METDPIGDIPPDTSNTEIDGDGRVVRKPTSSRAADDEETGSLSYHQTEAYLEGEHVLLSDSIFSLVESGGTLEVWLETYNHLHLTDEQIAEIRERNITIVLARENVTWQIPPANFLPGRAILRFYPGTPVGVSPQAGLVAPIYTTSIYQDSVRMTTYPGWMNIHYDLSNIHFTDISSLEAYYWDKTEKNWTPSRMEVDQQTFSIETRHTSAIGIFDSATIPEPEEEEVPKENEAIQPAETEGESFTFFNIPRDLAIILLVAALVAIFFAVRLRRKNK